MSESRVKKERKAALGLVAKDAGGLKKRALSGYEDEDKEQAEIVTEDTEQKAQDPNPNKPQIKFEVSILWINGEVALKAPNDELAFMTVMGDAISAYAVKKLRDAGRLPSDGAQAEDGKPPQGQSLIINPNTMVPVSKDFLDKIKKGARG